MWEQIKGWAKWFYDWITVITAFAVGLPDLLAALSVIDFSPIVGTEWGLKIVTAVAVAKALIAFVQAKRSA